MVGIAIDWQEWFDMPDPYLERWKAQQREGGEVPHDPSLVGVSRSRDRLAPDDAGSDDGNVCRPGDRLRLVEPEQ